MGYMFHENLGDLGYFNTSGHEQLGWGLNNTSPFSNLQPNYFWSGTDYAVTPGTAWGFYFYYGTQTDVSKYSYYSAWAVRDGDVSTTVPIPATMLLLGSGLIGLAGARRKIKR